MKNTAVQVLVIASVLTPAAAFAQAGKTAPTTATYIMKEEIDKVEMLLEHIPHDHIKLNIKVVSGKSGFELSQFAQKKQADLLVVGAPPRRFSIFDRVFTHDQEYIFADMPCNLLIVNPGKEASGV